MTSNATGLNSHTRRKLVAWVRNTQPNCHLCGGPIDLTLDHQRHPLGSVIDEVVPRKYGGSPVDSTNLAHAHRICNGSRGAKDITEQVRHRCRTLVADLTRSGDGIVRYNPW